MYASVLLVASFYLRIRIGMRLRDVVRRIIFYNGKAPERPDIGIDDDKEVADMLVDMILRSRGDKLSLDQVLKSGGQATLMKPVLR
jgi:hypothetical protein